MTIDQQRDAATQVLRDAGGAPQHDTLWVLIAEHTVGDTQHFQATLRQQGTALLFDSFRRPELIRAADVQMLRSSYDRQISMIHELAAEGLPLSSHTIDTRQLYELGRRVAAVLPTAVRQAIVGALRRARLRRHGLCVVLEVAAEAQELLSIPWELMVLPLAGDARTGVDGFLLLNADVSLVRQVQGVGRNTPPRLARPLKLQAFAATPQNVEPIDIETTRAALAQALPNGCLEGCWYDGPDTLGALQDRLREASPQIVHLLCHGEQNDVGRGPLRSDLLLTHRDGYMQRANTFDLAPILTLAPDIQLVVLHACHAGAAATAPQSASHGDAGHGAAESIALGFVQHGVPVVVAIQGAIGQQAAGAFVRACYAALVHGAGIEQAVAAGRVAIWAAGGLLDWSLPVIYQGSGQPEPETWHTRMADRLDGALHDPTTKRELRGGLVTLALALLTTAVLHWLLPPPPAPPQLDAFALPLAAWVLLGLAGPAIIAVAQRDIRDRADLSATVRGAARRAQWMGAYLGYTIAGVAGLAMLASLWATGLLALVPRAAPVLLGVALLAALFASYAVARSQMRSALALAPFAPALYDSWTLGIVLAAMLVLLAAPFGILLPGMSFSFLLEPAPSALTIGIALLSLLLRFRG